MKGAASLLNLPVKLLRSPHPHRFAPPLSSLYSRALTQRFALASLAQVNKVVNTKLEVLTENNARRVAKNLAQALRQRKTADAGVYQWAHQNLAVEELFER